MKIILTEPGELTFAGTLDVDVGNTVELTIWDTGSFRGIVADVNHTGVSIVDAQLSGICHPRHVVDYTELEAKTEFFFKWESVYGICELDSIPIVGCPLHHFGDNTYIYTHIAMDESQKRAFVLINKDDLRLKPLSDIKAAICNFSGRGTSNPDEWTWFLQQTNYNHELPNTTFTPDQISFAENVRAFLKAHVALKRIGICELNETEFLQSGWSARRSGEFWNIFKPNGEKWGFTGKAESERSALQLFRTQVQDFVESGGQDVMYLTISAHPSFAVV